MVMNSEELLAAAMRLLYRDLGSHSDRVCLSALVETTSYPSRDDLHRSFRLLVVPKNCRFACPHIDGTWSDVSADSALRDFEARVIPQLQTALGIVSESQAFDPVLMGC